MNRFLTLLLLLFLGHTSLCQDLLLLSPNQKDLRTGVHTIASFEANFRSNALDNIFMQKLVLGGKIGQENKDHIGTTLRDMNRAGGYVGGDLLYRNFTDTLFGSTDIGLFAKMSSGYDAMVAFPEDFFHIMFNGNSAYRGKTADLSGLSARFISYHKLGAGIFHKETMSYAGISFVAGSGYSEGELFDGELYTSELGDSLALNYSGEFQVTYNGALDPLTASWPGLALDFGFNIPFHDDLGLVSVEVTNLGFVNWRRGIRTYEADSSVYWTGVDIQDLLDSSIDNLDIPLLDDSLNYTLSAEERITWLPMAIDLRWLRKIDSRGYAELAVFVKPNGIHLPRFQGAYHYLVDDQTIVSAKATVGGYGRFRLGASFEKIYRDWYISAGTEDLPGLLLYDLRGKGAWFSFGKIFN